MSKIDTMPNNDELLVQVMSHEYKLLSQAYNEFHYFLLKNNNEHDDELKLCLYNSYAKILHHLYEFMKSCVSREASKTKSEDNVYVKKYIVVELDKIARQRGELQHKVESFEEFADDLRIYRNKVYGHVMKERFEKYPLVDFYSKHHAYIVWLVSCTKYWWSTEASELAKHKAVQDFSKLLNFDYSQRK